MIPQNALLKMKYRIVTIDYRTAINTAMSRMEKIISIEITGVHIETTKESCRQCRIPIQSVNRIMEVLS